MYLRSVGETVPYRAETDGSLRVGNVLSYPRSFGEAVLYRAETDGSLARGDRNSGKSPPFVRRSRVRGQRRRHKPHRTTGQNEKNCNTSTKGIPRAANTASRAD